jgi:hypothetical protein
VNYETAEKYFTKRSPLRRSVDGLKNTWLWRFTEAPNQPIHLRLFKTNILTYHPDGSFTVDNGGYVAPTTLRRFNDYLPGGCHVWSFAFQGDRLLMLRNREGVCRPWKNGATFTKDLERADLTLMNGCCAWDVRYKIRTYAKEYVHRLVYHGLPTPTKRGDCDLCIHVYDGGPDRDDEVDEHYLKHLNNGEMPSSLILAAVYYTTKHLQTASLACFSPNRCLWRNARTQLDKLRRTEAELMGLKPPDDDPRVQKWGLRTALERFLLKGVGFEMIEPREVSMRMYGGSSTKELMGW